MSQAVQNGICCFLICQKEEYTEKAKVVWGKDRQRGHRFTAVPELTVLSRDAKQAHR